MSKSSAARKSGAPALRADQPEWLARERAILEEAVHVTHNISARRWMVIHPENAVLLRAVGSLDPEFRSAGFFEKPRLLLWLSPGDRQLYTLVEYPALSRQPAEQERSTFQPLI